MTRPLTLRARHEVAVMQTEEWWETMRVRCRPSLPSRRLSFAHMEDVTPETMRRIKALGGRVTVQDRFVYSGGEVAA